MIRSTMIAKVRSFQAIKSTGVIVQVSPVVIVDIIARSDKPLVISTYNKSLIFGDEYLYLTPYRGIYLYAESKDPLEFLEDIELIVASEMWIPKA